MRKIQARVDLGSIIGHLIIWFFVIVFTLGFGAFLFPYSMYKTIVNRSVIVDGGGNTVAKLHCDLDIPGQIGHALLWFFLSIITLGIAGFFYCYKVVGFCLSHTDVIESVT